MITDVLLTGYTDFITDEFLASAFPGCRIWLTGTPQAKSSVKHRISVRKGELTVESCRHMFKMYEFDQVVYFSESIAPFGTMKGQELELLTTILECCQPETRTIYVSGAGWLAPDGSAVLQNAAKEICRRSTAAKAVDVVETPWVYTITGHQPTLTDLFRKGEHSLSLPEQQEISFLAAEDLALLLYRMFEDWEMALEPYQVPHEFVCTAGQLTAMICRESEGDEISFTFTDSPVREIPQQNSTALRMRFLWFPIYSLMEDLPTMVRNEREIRRSRLTKLHDLQRNALWVRVLELLTGFVLTEMLLRLTGISVQFQMVDFRLLFVVIMGTMYNMRMGLSAAALEAVSLVWAYGRQGTSWLSLFYAPTNWLPFIAYFTAGAICGYIRARDLELLKFANEEKDSITDRYNYLQQINEDVLKEKKEYKQQIIGSRDSFGKIFDISQKLNQSNPKQLLNRAVEVLETVMSSSSVAIYNCMGQRAYGRLAVSSAHMDLPKSMPMKTIYEKLNSVNDGEAWVNRSLDKNLPYYLYGIHQNGMIEAVVMLQKAEFSQMTLYYENLFRVICGLTANSLIKALEYREAVRREKCVEGTENVLLEKYFVEELRAELEAAEQKRSIHLLLHIQRENMPLVQTEQKILRCVRNTDIVGLCGGELYVILLQTSDEDLPIVEERFVDAGIAHRVIPAAEQEAIIS